MVKLKSISFLLFCALASCSSVAYDDKYYQLDNVPGHELRGDTLQHDRPLNDCEPTAIPSGGKAYKCVVHFYADYNALIKRVVDLENQLRACQQEHN